MHLKNPFRKPSAAQCRVEENLRSVHEKLAKYSTFVQMRYDNRVDYVPIEPRSDISLSASIVQHECCVRTEKVTMLMVRFEPGAELEQHSHDTVVEHIILIEGDAHDASTGTELVENQGYKISKGVAHKICSKNGAVMVVTLKPKIQPRAAGQCAQQ